MKKASVSKMCFLLAQTFSLKEKLYQKNYSLSTGSFFRKEVFCEQKKCWYKNVLFIAFVLFVILAFASSLCPTASAGDYGEGCPLNGTYNGTVRGGIYLKTVGSYGTSLNGAFYDVPDGRKITMLYFGIWEGSRGKAYNFTITINGNQSDTYHIDDSEELDTWCDAIDEPECHVSITGCGVNFVSYNATPLVVTGTNDVSITLRMESGDAVYAYQTTLFVVYENESMPEIQYWVKEGHEYPDIGVDFSMYFNETVNTGRIYTGSIESLKYWTIGFPHCFADEEPPCGWPTLNGNGIDEYDYVYSYGVTGPPSEWKPPKTYTTILRWDNIPSDYMTAPNNLFYYCGPGNLRLMVPILMLNYSEPGDLNVTDISPESLCVDYYNSIDATIVNTGGTAHFFNATLYVDGGLVDIKRVTNLGEGESTNVSFLWKPPATGSYVLNVTADVENVVRETDETNNSKTLSVVVTEAQPPEWSNQSSSVPEIPEGGTIELRVQGRADIGLDRAILATNETGTWINHTDYGSPMDMASLYSLFFTHTSKSDWKAQTHDNVTATETGEDVKLYQSVGTTNLAYNKTAYAKDSYSTYTPDKAVDGLASPWESDSMLPPASGGKPNWWYVNLSEVTTIRKIHINIDNADYGPFRYDVYISSDNETWTKKKEESAATSKTFTNLDWSCRYVNITYLENMGTTSDYAALNEFEAYGPGDYAHNGTLTSSTITTDNPIVAVTPEWNSTEPVGTNLSVNVSVDGGATWKPAVKGSELTWDYDVLNNTKLKYKVLFETTDVNETPVLHDITLNYVTRDPIEGEWLWSNFTWQNASIPGGTTVGWKIYYEDMLGQTNCTDVKTFVVGAPGPVIELVREQANTTGLNQETTVRLVVWNTDSSERDTSSLNLTEWIDPDWTVTDCGSCYENTSTYIKWTLGDLARDNYTMVSYKLKAPASSEVSTFKANCTYKYAEKDGSAEGPEFTVAVESGKAFFDFELDMDASTSTIDRDIPECTEKTVNYTVTNVGDAAPCDTVFIELKINKTAWDVTCAYCDDFYNDTDYYYLKWIENGSSWAVQQTKVFNFTVNSSQAGYYNFASNGTYDPPASAFTGQIYYKMAGSASPDPEEANANEPKEHSIILTASKKHFAAINTHKSIYLPGEPAFIGMAVLDDEGHMVCDAEVTLTITDPDNKETVLSTSNGLITVSPECSVYGVTNLPDYYMNYEAGGVGTYEMNLTAVTSDGVYSILDNFSVQNSVDFDIARDGPTRIYPPVPYVMNFTIKANKNYNGLVKEYVPASFEITPQQGLTVTTGGDTKILTWNKNLVKGETYNIHYEFDAPDVSLYLFLLGRLQIGSFEEKRDWMIVSDADTTLRPNSDGTTGSFTSTAATFYTEIDDDPDSSTDTDYVTGPNLADDSMFVLLGDTPADFTSADTVEINAKHQEVGSGDDTVDMYYQIFEPDETTAITAETAATTLTQGTYTIDAKSVSVTGTNDKTTWDGARLRIRQDYTKVKGEDTTSQARITAVEVTITYTPPADTTPPTYTNDGGNSTGSVTEGTIVETHVYWTDADSNLGKAVLRTNKTGSWTNESWHTFAGNPAWANVTFDTTGHAGKTICWVQWANDTSNNWNISMSTTAHCFDVLHVTKMSQVVINDTTPDQGDSVNIEAKLEYDNGTAIADQDVSFYYNTSFINSEFTNETGWATVLWDTTGVNNGTYKINATYSENSSIYTGASYNNTQEVEVVGVAEKIWVTNIELHFVRVVKAAGGVPNVVLTVHNTTFGNMLAGDNTTIYISLTLNNTGDAPATIEAVFKTNISVIYGLNGTAQNIIPGNYFELGPDGSEKALMNTTTKTFISTLDAGATVDYDVILTVPADQETDDYSGIVELSW